MVVSLDGYKFYPPNGNYSYRSYYINAKKTLDFLDNSPILENKKNIDHIEKDLAVRTFYLIKIKSKSFHRIEIYVLSKVVHFYSYSD